jgi:hypothetical protein
VASASDYHTVRLWNPATGAALQTIESGATIRRIPFSRDGQYLETNRGLLSLRSSFPNSSPPQVQSFSNIFAKGDWITRDTENLLWLPFDYRVMRLVLHRNQLALGYASDQVIFIEFRLP